MSVERIFDLSGGIQTATTWMLRKPNEVEDAENARFDSEIGAPVGRFGYVLEKAISTGETCMGIHEAKYDDGAIVFVASSDGTNTIIRAYNPVTDTVEDVITDLIPDVKVQFLDHLNEVYLAGMDGNNNRINIHNVRYDGTSFTVSTARNLLNAPKAAFIGENAGKLYAINVDLSGAIFPDRAYESSPPMGAITYVKGAQNNVYAPVTLVNQVPVMTSATAPSGAVSHSNAQASWEGWKIFKRDNTRVGGSWFTAGGTATGWVRYDFGAGNEKIIQYYTMRPLATNPSMNDPSGAPRNWSLQGSQDGSTWTDLHTVSAQAPFNAGEERTYSFSNTTPYRYYRLNVTQSQGTNATGGNINWVTMNGLYLFSSTSGSTQYRQMAVDSVRYIKPGYLLDVYKAGTDQKLRSITVDSVDKANDTFNHLPFEKVGMTFATATDDATATSGIFDTTEFATGQAVVLNGGGTAPGGLTFNTTYYVIRTGNDAKIKFATSYDLALLGQAIDITSTGSGAFTLSVSYVFNDNDELWLSGRHNPDDLTVLWNTDYRTEQTADYLRIPPGSASDTSITGWVKSNNRLQLFTATSTHQWDNANFVPIFEDVGCISHWTIKNSGTWIIWLDAEGRVRARDGASGQDEIISRFVKNRYLEKVPGLNLREASASMHDGNYKLSLGQVGEKYWRIVYNFDSNSWWRETHTRDIKFSLTSRMSGKERLYFITDGVKLYLDEEGDTDDGDTIPVVVEYGRRNFGTEFMKSAIGAYVYGKNISGAQLFISGTDRKWVPLGQLTEPVSRVSIGDAKKNIKARDFNFKVSMHQKGDRPRLEGLAFHYSFEENNFG